MKTNFKLMLLALMTLITSSAFAADLKGTTQYDSNGFKYKILTIDTSTEDYTVSVSQNVYGTNGDAALVIPAKVTINVKGTTQDAVDIDEPITFKIVEIEEEGFKGLLTGKDGAEITSIQIGENINTIGEGAFSGCTNVTSITFDDNTNNMTIGNYAFEGTQPTTLDLSPIEGTLEANKWFGDFTTGVATNSSLTKVIFNDKLTKIIANAFAGFTGLTSKESIVFPETGLTGTTYLDIKAGAFKETPIDELDLTEARIQTLNRLFEKNNVTLKKVYMAKSVVTLNTNALADCIQLAEVDFSNSTKLTTLLDGSLSNTIVDEYDFSKCYEASGSPRVYTSCLNFTAGEDPFVNATTTTNKNLVKVILPYDETLGYSNVSEIGTVFADCEKLTTITYLDKSKITVVNDAAFANDISLTELSFPASLTNVNDEPFTNCPKLAKLTFDGTAGVLIGSGVPIFDATQDALKELYITVEADATTSAVINTDAFSNNTGLSVVEIAKGGTFAGTINPLTLDEDVDATVTFGNIAAGATIYTITGPVGTKKTALTIGDYANAAGAAYIDGIVSNAQVGAVTDASVLVAVGQAETIQITGEISASPLTVPAVNNALTTLDFGSIIMPAATIAATTFDENNAPNLVSVTWTPADENATAAFDQAAFGTTSVGVAAKVTLHTTTAVGDGKYSLDESNLFNVIFDATPAPVTPDYVDITVIGKEENTGYYYGKLQAGSSRIAISKETADGAADVVVYSAFVDSKDQKIYMDPLAISDGKYIVAKNQVVIVRVKNPQDVTERSQGGYEKTYGELAATTSEYATMRNVYDGGSYDILNDLEMTSKVFSSDYIGTKYAGKTLYAMANPANEGALVWKKVDVKSYLPKGAVFVQTDEITAAPGTLDVVWLDGSEDVTGIIELMNSEKASNNDDAIYNLQGVRVSNMNQKGIYIKNGKKFIVK